MNCPKHPDQRLKQLRPDGFGCPVCGREWLIHRLSRKYPILKPNDKEEKT